MPLFSRVPDVIEIVELRPLYAGAAQELADISTGSISNKRAFIEESLQRRTVIGARTGERIVGYAIWDHAFFGRPFVWLLGVDSSFRRRGIAAKLLGEFAAQCVGEPLFTSTNASNAPMHALLDTCGFARSGWVENLDPGDPEIFYFKPPDAGRR